MARNYCSVSGEIYNGAAHDLILGMGGDQGSDLRVRTKGTGSCKIVGKMHGDDDYKVLSLVRMSDFAVVDTITDNEIYATDVTGLHQISVQSASGFTSVLAEVWV